MSSARVRTGVRLPAPPQPTQPTIASKASSPSDPSQGDDLTGLPTDLPPTGLHPGCLSTSIDRFPHQYEGTDRRACHNNYDGEAPRAMVAAGLARDRDLLRVNHRRRSQHLPE